MNDPRKPEDPTDALARAATFAVRSVPSGRAADEEPEADSTAQPHFDGEDFLFHLYRGSELLTDNCVEQAKEELERALRMQPRDIEGQGLLGVVYFRLGLYPRAIEIYQEIIRSCPGDNTPRVNLGLCYIKTAQHVPAREVLEEVIRREPQHTRAWGYLGLVFERLGDYAKAQAAFEHAGQPHLARRMQDLLEELTGVPSEPAPQQANLRRAADAALELDAAEGPAAPRPQPPARASLVGRFGKAVPSVPPPEELLQPPPMPRSLPPSSLVQAASLVPPARAERTTLHRPGVVTVRVDTGFAVRQAALVALSHDSKPFHRATLFRRSRGRETEEHFGGSSAWSLLEGAGFLTLSAQNARVVTLFDLATEFVYVREANVLGFDSTAHYENGRLPGISSEPVPMAQFSGQGLVVVESTGAMGSMRVSSERPLVLRAERVLGWTGRLLAHPVEPEASPTHAAGFVTFGGDGAVLIDIG